MYPLFVFLKHIHNEYISKNNHKCYKISFDLVRHFELCHLVHKGDRKSFDSQRQMKENMYNSSVSTMPTDQLGCSSIQRKQAHHWSNLDLNYIRNWWLEILDCISFLYFELGPWFLHHNLYGLWVLSSVGSMGETNSRDPAARCWQRGSSSFHRKNNG